MKFRTLLPLVCTYFLDFVGLFMVVPIFAPTFLDVQTKFLHETDPLIIRTFIIGSLIAMYGVAQFIGAPILGELSDQFGRKKILTLGLICLIFGYAIGALSFMSVNLPLLFFSRFLVGFSSGNGSVLFAAASELSTQKTRAKNIGYLTGAAAVGIVIGPFIGSHLIQSKFFSWFTLATPFWVMSFFGILNLLLILFLYRDHKKPKRRKFELWTGFSNIWDCLKRPRLRDVLLAYFFFVISSESIFVSLPIYLLQKFKVTSLFIGYLFVAASALSSITSLFINPKISKKVSSYEIYFYSVCFLILCYLFIFIPEKSWLVFIPYGLAGIPMVLCWTHGNALAGDLAREEEQGKVLGVAQSLLSLAIVFGPLVIGGIAAVHRNLALGFSPLMAFFSLFFIAKSWYDKVHYKDVTY